MLLNEVRYISDTGLDFRVPAYFSYDGGSIPPPLWPVTGPKFGSLADHGYLPHDYLYYLSRKGRPICDRETADRIMLEFHLFMGVDTLLAYGIFTVVRAAGWRSWGNGTPDMPDDIDDSYDEFLDP